MSTTHSSIHPQSSPQPSNDEIDLGQVADALSRHKIFIGGITIAAAMVSTLYAFTKRPIWEGSFQIVLENQRSGSAGRLSQFAASNPIIANLAGLSSSVGEGSLKTEVKSLRVRHSLNQSTTL